VKKFCAARYGRFADQARTALLTLEDITRNTCSIPNTSLKTEAAIDADLRRAAKLAEGIAAAMKSADDPAIKRSLERLGLMCDYSKRDLEVQKLRATGASKEQIREEAAALHEWVSSHADDGVFLINAQRLNRNRMLNRYGVGTRGS
jgi:hypothetical protein